MAIAEPAKEVDAFSLLQEACARNTSAELHFQEGELDLITARVRLLDMDLEQVYMDSPQSNGQPLKLQPRQPVTVHFLLNGSRYAFQTRITRPRCYVQLNAAQRVSGAAAAVPANVRPQQRRADFRLSLASYADLTVQIHGGTPEHGGSAPVKVGRTTARLVNISAGGIGSLFENVSNFRCYFGDVFFLRFTLPEMETELLFLSELRHFRRIHDGLSMIVGFKFLPWALVPMRANLQFITRFIASEQRRQMRRTK